MRTAVPGVTSIVPGSPARTSPAIRSSAGESSEARSASELRTANPSMAELAKRGRS
jgi:hypothetical protein